MKKLGFTMAELLVTLGIIAVVAAMTAPMVGGLLPDKNKATVLKIYKTVSEINEEVLNDPTIYRRTDNCTGLDCTDVAGDVKYQPSESSPDYNSDVGWSFYSGRYKYARVLFVNLNKNHDTQIRVGTDGNVATMQFTTTDNLVWYVSGNGQPGSVHQIMIDTNPDGGNNCSYGEGCTNKPDRFLFNVSNKGIVSGADPLTRAYLSNTEKMNDKKTDYARAAAILAEEQAASQSGN